MRIKFLFSRLFRMDYKNMFNTLKVLKERSGRSYMWLIKDMIYCAIVYNAGYIDYKIAEFYKLNPAKRKTQITRGLSNQIVKLNNPKEHWHYFDDKAEFNTLFKEQIKREWLLLNENTSIEEFNAFIKNHKSFIIKPLEGSSGVGIRKISIEKDKSEKTENIFKDLTLKGPYLAEEIIKQHEQLDALSPTSVNTVRVATLAGSKAKGIVYAFLRIGNGELVDNVDCGGMAARVDLKTGKILTVGADKKGNVFSKHPITEKAIIGFEIPYWEDIKIMCLKAMDIIPQMRYIAWDVAITPSGPCFVEGNSFPSHAVPQFAAHYSDGIGIMEEFRKFIDI